MRKVLYILGQLEDEDVAWLGKVGRKRDLADRHVLIRQGVPVGELFIVLQGLLSVTVDGRQIAELGPGEIVGEMSLIDKRPPGATVSAARHSNVLAVERTLVHQKLEVDTAFAARFYKAIAMFLSARMRASAMQAGDGKATSVLLEDEEEVDLDVLDNVHLAGLRFEAMMKTLLDAN